MPKIIFVEDGGRRHEVHGQVGLSVMRAAVDNNVPGIDADCGGECACATCHVYVASDWEARTGVAGVKERQLLEFTASRRSNSRLSCQIMIASSLDGLLVELPLAQH